MTTPSPHVPTTSVTELDIEHNLPAGWGLGRSGAVLFWIALAFSTFQIATSVYAILPTQVLRSMHVGFLVLVASVLIGNHRSTHPMSRVIGWTLGLLGFGAGLYQWIFYIDLVNNSGDLSHLDLAVGMINLVVLFVVAWRLMGPALPVICLVFIAYALFGRYLPRPLDHRGFSLEQVVEHMGFGTEGIYATPTGVSATYIFLFILFGAFLERAGMIQLFNDVALGLVGAARGGAAKVAVISSALMGTISGSGVANVVTTGQFTIPLMKRFGYSSSFAGGVEATASMGGQIMPPVMGAVAFIMAENIGVPYSEIVKAAIIPAILYFASAFWMVHLEAGKHNLMGMARSELPSPIAAIKRQWHLALPLAVLVYLLMDGFTPLFAGSVGLALTVIMILGGALAMGFGSQAARVVFWIGLGLLSASFFHLGIGIIIALVAILILVNLFSKGGRETLILCRDGLADGARQALPVGLACAIVGTVIGTMTLTGA
ncbi:MAG: TRAP transporter fused permease subunit, partial [Hyphomicrobiales bacterium]|nr:TRAP transporter fused permease subunit [Hyphomicrobiales bacterium]